MALSAYALSPRPAFPALLQCAFSLWLGCLLSGECCGYVSAQMVVNGAAALLALAFGGFLVAVKKDSRVRNVALWLLFFLLGMLLVGISVLSLEAERNAYAEQGSGAYSIRILDDPSKGLFGYQATASIWRLDAGPVERALGGSKVTILLDDNTYSYGDEFRAKVSFKSSDDSQVAYLNRNGIVLRCTVSEVQNLHSSKFGFLSSIRSRYAERVENALSFDGSNQDSIALVNALVIGDRRLLFGSQLYNDVKVCGLAHLVAVSGAHLAIVMGVVAACVKLLRIPRCLAMVLQMAFLLLYLVMVGFPLSCVRAALMACSGLLAFASSKRSYALSALSVTIIAILTFDSYAAFSVSFSLSALSTLGIVLFTPKFCSWLPATGKLCSSFFTEPFAMTCAALLTTFPLSIASFSQFSLISPLGNILAVPFVTATCVLGVLSFAVMPFPFASDVFIYGAYCCAGCFQFAVSSLAGLPFASIPVDAPFVVMAALSLLLCISIWLAWPKRFPVKRAMSALGAVVACSAIVGFGSYGQTSIVMLDVGQGDAFLIRSQGKTLLIDTGNNPKKLFSALARNGVLRLDGLLLSHADDDHCGCLADMKGVVPIGKVYLAQGMDAVGTKKTDALLRDARAAAGDDGVEMLRLGDTMAFGALTCRVVSPSQLSDEGENDDSVCLLVSSDLNADGVSEWKAFFGGDAESDILEKLVSDGVLGKIDILKVSHHGSKASLDEQVLDAMQPEIGLISVGAKNRYGHPASNTLSLLESRGVEVFRSDIQGDVVCNLRQEEIDVRAMK